MLLLQAPASKSVSHRMMIGAALADGNSVVRRVLESQDLVRTITILRSAGADIVRTAAGTYTVQGTGGRLRGGSPLSCDVHESGTTCRLLTAVLASGEGAFRIHGAPRMHQRPIGELTGTLEKLGVAIHFEQHPGFPPFELKTRGLAGGTVDIGMEESSQYLSGLLLAAPQAKAPLTIGISGKKAVSWPYVGLTLSALERFGIPFVVETRVDQDWEPTDWRNLQEAHPGMIRFRMCPAAFRAGSYAVEGDWSGASYLLAAGAIGRVPVRVDGLEVHSLQGDRRMLELLQAMGAATEITPEGITIFPSELHGITADMGACPDLVPTMAVLAAFAEGETTITGVAHLRIKESDRIAAPAEELAKIGVQVQEHADGLTIFGRGKLLASRQPDGIAFSAHTDHRIAMSLALLEVRGGQLALDNPSCVGKSFPDFWEVWETIRAANRNA